LDSYFLWFEHLHFFQILAKKKNSVEKNSNKKIQKN
jgi:hypothetical protein